jgi:hypothetical protein
VNNAGLPMSVSHRNENESQGISTYVAMAKSTTLICSRGISVSECLQSEGKDRDISFSHQKIHMPESDHCATPRRKLISVIGKETMEKWKEKKKDGGKKDGEE